jgi:hypothetical protein
MRFIDYWTDIVNRSQGLSPSWPLTETRISG